MGYTVVDSYYEQDSPVVEIGSAATNFTVAAGSKKNAWSRIGNRVWVNGLANWSSKNGASGPLILKNACPYLLDTSILTFASGTVIFIGTTEVIGAIKIRKESDDLNFNFVLADVSTGVLTNLETSLCENVGYVEWSITYPIIPIRNN